jgi:hypothetical protein
MEAGRNAEKFSVIEPRASFSMYLQVLAAVDVSMGVAPVSGEPLSFAIWEAGAPSTPDPDPRPVTLLRSYGEEQPQPDLRLNARV